MKEALILFVRTPEKGKVKTRIAAIAGDDAALEIYQRLLQHTQQITAPLSCDKYVFYADRIETDDLWNGYNKQLQPGTDLGNRMLAAFSCLFKKGYQRVCIIGSDCYDLSTTIIEQAFTELSKTDLVIGPANDGGYYLLGMKDGVKDIFQGIAWSTEKVLEQTIAQITASGFGYSLLPVLSDVDTAADVPEQWKEVLAFKF